MIHKFFKDRRPHTGMIFAAYFKKIEQEAELERRGQIIKNEHGGANNLVLNFQRMQRINKTYSVNPKLLSLLKKISEPQIWMVLTEEWCGDSAQIIPYIAKMAEANSLIDLRFLLRDENLDIMDLYLSPEKTRSIPKLVAFNKDGEELFQWGARPFEGDEIVRKLKAEGKTKDEFLKQLHLWYAKNHGVAIESELTELLNKIV